jgi:putative oxidoreductase
VKTFLRLFRLDFIPVSSDFALLLLRVWVGGSLLLLHGWDKLKSLVDKPGQFPDPLHIGGMGSHILAVFAEALCASLLVLGLFTRFAALSCAITMGVAFVTVHNAKLSGTSSGELPFIYLAGFVTLVLMGGGHYALDSSMKAKVPTKKKD